MRQIEFLLNEYGESHKNKTNILIHAVAVPAIFFVTLGLVWSIPTPEFLDYFNVKSLDELPSLKEIQDLEKLGDELDLQIEGEIASNAEGSVSANDEENFADIESAGEALGLEDETLESDEVIVAEDKVVDEESSDNIADDETFDTRDELEQALSNDVDYVKV